MKSLKLGSKLQNWTPCRRYEMHKNADSSEVQPAFSSLPSNYKFFFCFFSFVSICICAMTITMNNIDQNILLTKLNHHFEWYPSRPWCLCQRVVHQLNNIIFIEVYCFAPRRHCIRFNFSEFCNGNLLCPSAPAISNTL